MLRYGCHHMSNPLTHVLMRKPGESLRNANPKAWNYNALFDVDAAIAEHKSLTDILEQNGVKILWIENTNDGLADAMFVKDASIITKVGAILFNMGKELRSEEPATHARLYKSAGIPILGQISAPGCIEGGDLIWLDESTLITGMGFRSNREGVRQLNTLLNPHNVDVIGFDLPNWRGEDYCLHLMSFISPLNASTYVAYMPLVPVGFLRLLQDRGIHVIASPEDEFHASYGQNVNVLALSPTRCVMLDGFPETQAAIENANIEVLTFKGDALCMACEGGPTCLTNPIYRETDT